MFEGTTSLGQWFPNSVTGKRQDSPVMQTHQNNNEEMNLVVHRRSFAWLAIRVQQAWQCKRSCIHCTRSIGSSMSCRTPDYKKVWGGCSRRPCCLPSSTRVRLVVAVVLSFLPIPFTFLLWFFLLTSGKRKFGKLHDVLFDRMFNNDSIRKGQMRTRYDRTQWRCWTPNVGLRAVFVLPLRFSISSSV